VIKSISYNVSVYAMFFARFFIILSNEKGKKYGWGASRAANRIRCVSRPERNAVEWESSGVRPMGV